MRPIFYQLPPSAANGLKKAPAWRRPLSWRDGGKDEPMGDMGRVDIHGEVNGQVVFGRNNVVINAEQGAYVAYRPEGPPRLQLRSRPYPGGAVLRGQDDILAGRESELGAIGTWLA